MCFYSVSNPDSGVIRIGECHENGLKYAGLSWALHMRRCQQTWQGEIAGYACDEVKTELLSWSGHILATSGDVCICVLAGDSRS